MPLMLISLIGCGSTLNEMGGIGILETNIDRLDGATEVTITATPMHNFEGDVATTRLGASWESEYPDKVFLRLTSASSVKQSDTYVSFESMEVSISGDIRTLILNRTLHNSGGYNSVTRDIYTNSSTSVLLDYDYFKLMVTNPTTKIRVNTTNWFEDIDFKKETNGIGADLAKASLKKFITEVDNKM